MPVVLIAAIYLGDRSCQSANPYFDEQNVGGTVQLPSGASISPADLTVISFSGSTTPAGDGTFKLTAPEVEKQQLVVACTQSDSAVLVGYVDPASPNAVDVSPRTTIIALTLLNPFLVGSNKAQRDQYIAAVQTHTDFAPLVAELEGYIIADPDNALNATAHPELFSRVAAISVSTLEELGGSLGGDDGEIYAPYIEDAPGDKIAFVNPTCAYYNADIQGPKRDQAVVYPETNIEQWTPGIPPVYKVPPKRTEYRLGDGQFDIILYRGLDPAHLTSDAWLNYDNTEGRASLANIAKAVCQLLDLTIGWLPTTPWTSLRLNWTKCSWDLTKMSLSILQGNPTGVMDNTVALIRDNVDELSYWLWQEGGHEVTYKLLRLSANWAGPIGLFIRGYTLLTVKYPFFRDLCEANTVVAFNVKQTSGVLTLNQLYNGPNQPAAPTGPAQLEVNEQGTWQSSATHPDGLEVQLVFFWDDGDYTASDFVPSGTTVEMSHAFTERGRHRVTVKARSESGPSGLYSVPSDPLIVTVAGGTNQPPAVPAAPSGPAYVNPGVRHTYTAVTADPDNDEVSYKFADGVTESEWCSPVPSGLPVPITKSWATAGKYYLKVKARDALLAETGWSQPLQVTVATNSAPDTPNAPTGPDSGMVGIQYEYIAGTTDPEGDDIRYIFDWDDGSYDTTQFIGSGVTIGRYKTWSSARTYAVKVRAEDDNGAPSDWSAAHYVYMATSSGNNPPNTPTTPTGPTSGQVGQSYSFSSSATDPDGDQVAIRFDWGDGTQSNWSNLVNGGTTVTMSHTWGSANTYQVKAQAKDDEDAESNWSSGHSINIASGGTPGTCKWYFRTGNFVVSSPAVGTDGTIYVGSYDRKLYAINPNSTKKWEFATEGGITSSPAVGSDGTIYVGSLDNKLYAISPSGTKKWEFATGSYVYSSPAVGSDGTIYVGSYDNKLYAVNPDGTKKWEFATDNSVRSSPAVGSDGTIYVGSYDNKLYAVNPDGTKRWECAIGDHASSSPAVGTDGTIYVGSSDNKLYAINPSGTKKWEFATDNSVGSSPAVGSDGTIYVGSYDNKLYAINPSGTKKWEFATGDCVESSPAVGSDGTIYVGSWDHKLYAVNPDGTKRWECAIDDGVSSSPAVGTDGTIYFGSSYFLYAIYGSGTLASTPWPKFHHDLRNTGRVGGP